MKRTGVIILAIISLLFVGGNRLSAQVKPIVGPEWNFILGEWVGEGSGVPGQGAGWFTFTKELGEKIIERKSHTVIPAANGRPETIHDDLMVIYLDNVGLMTKAIYFDNEGHIINYAAKFNQADNSLVFTSEAQPNMPRFRLTYKIVENNLLNTDFEFAPPNQPEAFSKYISGKSHKRTATEKLN